MKKRNIEINVKDDLKKGIRTPLPKLGGAHKVKKKYNRKKEKNIVRKINKYLGDDDMNITTTMDKYLYDSKNKKLYIKPNVRKKINTAIRKLTTPKSRTVYFKAIPLQDIFDILEKNGVVALQQDNTEWDGFLTGATGTITIALAPSSSKMKGNYTTYEPYVNTSLALQWYKMQTGKYEVTCYIG